MRRDYIILLAVVIINSTFVQGAVFHYSRLRPIEDDLQENAGTIFEPEYLPVARVP